MTTSYTFRYQNFDSPNIISLCLYTHTHNLIVVPINHSNPSTQNNTNKILYHTNALAKHEETN